MKWRNDIETEACCEDVKGVELAQNRVQWRGFYISGVELCGSATTVLAVPVNNLLFPR